MEDFNPEKNYVVNKKNVQGKEVNFNLPGPKKNFAGYSIALRENRIQFMFPEKPAVEFLNILKRYSFKWSPTRRTWVRKLTQNAVIAAKEVSKEFKKLQEDPKWKTTKTF